MSWETLRSHLELIDHITHTLDEILDPNGDVAIDAPPDVHWMIEHRLAPIVRATWAICMTSSNERAGEIVDAVRGAAVSPNVYRLLAEVESECRREREEFDALPPQCS